MQVENTPSSRKRSRVVKACDRCRSKKRKCDGSQPCGPCSYYEYKCTYNRMRRHTGPLYTLELEARYERLKTLLSTICPHANLDDPDWESDAESGEERQERGCPSAVEQKANRARKTDHNPQSGCGESDTLLDTMIEATGRLEIDNQGRHEYYDRFAGVTFFRRLQEQCGLLLGGQLPNNHDMPSLALLETPEATKASQRQRLAIVADVVEILPPREAAWNLISIGLVDGCCLTRFVHRPDFDRGFDRVYNLDLECYNDDDLKFLPLLHIMLAIGVLFSCDGAGNLSRIRLEGSKYFHASQRLLDVTSCRDLTSLQVIVAMIIYLQSTGNISLCYSYISVAMASSLRMGLHRSDPTNAFGPIEHEIRKRTFWVLRTMETYVSTLLGLPRIVSDEDIDQEKPSEFEDEYILDNRTFPAETSHISTITATKAHIELITILAKVVRSVYASGYNFSFRNGLCQVDASKVVEIENDLERWSQQLHHIPNTFPATIRRDHLLLRIAYGHVQMILYRPFLLPYLGNSSERSLAMKSPACATACVKAAKQVVSLFQELQELDSLLGPYWFSIYTTFSAVLCLIVFILGNGDHPSTQDFLEAAENGRLVLNNLSARSIVAERCAASLSPVFEKLATKYQSLRGNDLSKPRPKLVDHSDAFMDQYMMSNILTANWDTGLSSTSTENATTDAPTATALTSQSSCGEGTMLLNPELLTMSQPHLFPGEGTQPFQLPAYDIPDISTFPLCLDGNADI